MGKKASLIQRHSCWFIMMMLCNNKPCQICSREEQEEKYTIRTICREKTYWEKAVQERQRHLGCSAFPARAVPRSATALGCFQTVAIQVGSADPVTNPHKRFSSNCSTIDLPKGCGSQPLCGWSSRLLPSCFSCPLRPAALPFGTITSSSPSSQPSPCPQANATLASQVLAGP